MSKVESEVRFFMENKLKQKIQAGNYTLGTFIEIGNMNALEALHNTGLDFIVIDAEHGHFDTETISDLIRAAEQTGLTPLVRIGEISRAEIQRVLDAGAMGLIMPGLKTVQEIRELVQLAKYPPTGQRGFSLTRAARWGAADSARLPLSDYMSSHNREVLLLPQCEYQELLQVIDQVVQVDGVDGVFIGPYDLSISLGIPGRFDEPLFTEAVEKIRQTVKKAGKVLLYFSMDPSMTGQLVKDQFDGIALSLDTKILNDGYRRLVHDARNSVKSLK